MNWVPVKMTQNPRWRRGVPGRYCRYMRTVGGLAPTRPARGHQRLLCGEHAAPWDAHACGLLSRGCAVWLTALLTPSGPQPPQPRPGPERQAASPQRKGPSELSAESAEMWGRSVTGKGNSTDDGPEAGSSLVNPRKRKRLVWLQFGKR